MKNRTKNAFWKRLKPPQVNPKGSLKCLCDKTYALEIPEQRIILGTVVTTACGVVDI